MKRKSLLWIRALLLMLTGCSSDDDNSNADNVNPKLHKSCMKQFAFQIL